MATLVFGGTGLVGRALADLTGEDKSNNGYVFLSSKDCDLLNREQTEMILAHYKPQLVIHLAAVVGGLYMNISENRRMFYDNITMNTNLIEACVQAEVPNFLGCLSLCVFPDDQEPSEAGIHDGPPHGSNYGYAYAKRMMEVHCRLVSDERPDFCYRCFSPTNIYGPYDNFSLTNAHVIPMLIHKAYIAKQLRTALTVRGTGSAERQFIFSRDVAKLILIMVRHLKEVTNGLIICPPLLNNDQVRISDVARMIAQKYHITIAYDTSFTDGQVRIPASAACLQTLLQSWNELFEFTSLEQGIHETIEWFNMEYPNIRGFEPIAPASPANPTVEYWEITFLKNGMRLTNFMINNRTLNGELRCFSAIDTTAYTAQYIEKYANLGVIDRANERLMQTCRMLPGKTGCNASYYELFQQLLRDSQADWFLILEDDVIINQSEWDPKLLQDAIHVAQGNISHYVKLIIFQRFREAQLRQEEVGPNFFKKCYDWGTGAQLISRKGIEILMDSRPWDAIDEHINKIPHLLNPITFCNKVFTHLGMESMQLQKGQPYGSLIYGNGLMQGQNYHGFPAQRPYATHVEPLPKMPEMEITEGAVIAVMDLDWDVTPILTKAKYVYQRPHRSLYTQFFIQHWNSRDKYAVVKDDSAIVYGPYTPTAILMSQEAFNAKALMFRRHLPNIPIMYFK